MKYLTDRHEIGEALNFGKYPVLTLNRENNPCSDIAPNSDYAVGCRVRVAWDKKDSRYAGMTTKGEIYIENGRIAISQGASTLKASFGYKDVMEDVAWANAPVVHKGQEVVLVEEWPSKKQCTVRIMKVHDSINIHCETVAVLDEIEEG